MRNGEDVQNHGEDGSLSERCVCVCVCVCEERVCMCVCGRGLCVCDNNYILVIQKLLRLGLKRLNVDVNYDIERLRM